MLWNKAAAVKQHEQISQELTLMEKQCEKIVHKSQRKFDAKSSPWRIINVEVSITRFWQYNQFQSLSNLLGVEWYASRVDLGMEHQGYEIHTYCSFLFPSE